MPATWPLPLVLFDNEAFWRGGERGQLLITHCDACGAWTHPPVPRCRGCGGATAPRAVSGRGTVFSHTVNHQPWLPGMDVPFAIGVIELDEQPGLRLTARLVDVDVDEVAIGMRVAVDFEPNGDVWIPVFRRTDA